MKDYRDLTIEAFADSEAELFARVGELEADLSIYREIALAAIQALNEAYERERRQCQRLHRLVDELRTLRPSTLHRFPPTLAETSSGRAA